MNDKDPEDEVTSFAFPERPQEIKHSFDFPTIDVDTTLRMDAARTVAIRLSGLSLSRIDDLVLGAEKLYYWIKTGRRP